jgi:hypothetical protein
MNVVTVAVFGALLLYTGGLAVYVWRMRRRARSRWLVRFALGVQTLYGAPCVAGLVIFYNHALSGSLAAELPLYLSQPVYAAFVVRQSTRPIDPALLRFPYAPTKRDLRLLWTMFAALSVPVLLVLLVVIAHRVG